MRVSFFWQSSSRESTKHAAGTVEPNPLRKNQGSRHTPLASVAGRSRVPASDQARSALLVFAGQAISMADRPSLRFTCVHLTAVLSAAGRLAAAATSQSNAGQQADENQDDLESFHDPPPASFEAHGNWRGQLASEVVPGS